MKDNTTELRILRFIQQYVREHTYPPSLNEIARGCYLSRSSVSRYIDRLQMQGRIARDFGIARGITLLEPLPPSEDEAVGGEPSSPPASQR
jgi:DNA-binding MarR family transcriptional regulator